MCHLSTLALLNNLISSGRAQREEEEKQQQAAGVYSLFSYR
jgi:hypothetical protein